MLMATQFYTFLSITGCPILNDRTFSFFVTGDRKFVLPACHISCDTCRMEFIFTGITSSLSRKLLETYDTMAFMDCLLDMQYTQKRST